MAIQQQPGVSVIARLMGIDAIPMTMTMPAVNKQETSSSNLLKNEARPLIHQPKCSYSRRRCWRWRCLRRKTSTRLNNAKVGLGGRSRHPQEHLLQQMEEDFLSWQASQAAATTWGKGNNNSSSIIQIIAQDKLRREKMATRCTQRALELQMTHSEADKSDEDGNCKGSTSEIVLLKPLSVSDIPAAAAAADDAGQGQMLLFGFGLSRVKRDHSMDQLLQQVKDRLQNQLKLTDLLGRKRLSRSEAFRAHSTTDRNCATGAKHASPEHKAPHYKHHEFEAPDTSELSFRTDNTVQTEDKAYLRRVLIAAGLLYYDGSLEEKANNALEDTMLTSHIFDEVEEDIYCCYHDRNSTDHRMLFDLANEALQILVQGAKAGYSSLCHCRWVIDSIGVSRGSKLLDHVWQQVQALRYPQTQETQTIESMVACQVRKSVWDAHADVYLLGRKLERAIFDELIQDLLLEISIPSAKTIEQN